MNNFSEDEKILELIISIFSPNSKLNDQEKQEKQIELDKLLRSIDRIHVREYKNNKLARAIEGLLKDDNDIFQLEDLDDQIDAGINLGMFYPAVYACNMYKLVPPFVRHGVQIPEKMKSLYAESRYCFISEQYNAAIVLSRAIIELALKIKIGLPEESKKWTAGVTLERAREVKIIDEKSARIADEIIKNGDWILHRAKNATEEESLKALDHTKKVLEVLFG